jgi:hypothetical protein
MLRIPPEKRQLKLSVERLQITIGNQENKLLNLKRLLQPGMNQSFLDELDKLMNEVNQSVRDLKAMNVNKLPNNSDIVTQIKTLDVLIEEVRNKRQGETSTFESFDQKVNQLFNILAAIMKNEKEIAQSIIRNLL